MMMVSIPIQLSMHNPTTGADQHQYGINQDRTAGNPHSAR